MASPISARASGIPISQRNITDKAAVYVTNSPAAAPSTFGTTRLATASAPSPSPAVHLSGTMPLWGGEWNNNLTLNTNGVGFGIEYDSPTRATHFDNSQHNRSGEFGSD